MFQTMGTSLIELEGHLSRMLKSSSKAARVAELLALDVAGLTVMKKKHDEDATEKETKLNNEKEVALKRQKKRKDNEGKGWCCKRKNVAGAGDGGRAASETTADEQQPSMPSDARVEMTGEMTGEITAEKKRLVKANAAAEAVTAKTEAEDTVAAAVAAVAAAAHLVFTIISVPWLKFYNTLDC